MAVADSTAFLSLNHIAPLPILHALEYPLGSRMHLGVVHLRLEARGRPFPRSPRSRSRVNPRVLRPLTRGPQGPPSPLQTPHGCPGVQRIFPTSRGRAPSGWPMVHHSMATGFPIPRGRCLALSAIFPCSVSFATPRCPIFLCLIPSPARSRRPAVSLSPGGFGAALATLFSRSRPLIPSLIPCLYPTRPPATPWRGPTGSSSIRGPFRAPCTGRSDPIPLSRVHGAFSSPFPDDPVPRRLATFSMSRRYWPTCVLAREHSASVRLWPSRDATTCTPPRAW